MLYLSGEEISQFVEKEISRERQIEKNSFRLTVKSIKQFTWMGHLDFSGKEYVQATNESLRPQKKQPQDKHGWWSLQQGEYIAEFNQKITIPEDTVVIIQPLDRLLLNGASHHALILENSEKEIRVMIRVGSPGIAIKENSPVSKLIMLKVIP